MFEENKLPDTKFFGGEEYDIDWDTFSGGNGLTVSQAQKKKEYYATKGYKCRAVKDASTGRVVFYVLDVGFAKKAVKVNKARYAKPSCKGGSCGKRK
jgi:hypothetical protein